MPEGSAAESTSSGWKNLGAVLQSQKNASSRRSDTLGMISATSPRLPNLVAMVWEKKERKYMLVVPLFLFFASFFSFGLELITGNRIKDCFDGESWIIEQVWKNK